MIMIMLMMTTMLTQTADVMMMPPLLLSSFTGCGGEGESNRNNSSGDAFKISSF